MTDNLYNYLLDLWRTNDLQMIFHTAPNVQSHIYGDFMGSFYGKSITVICLNFTILHSDLTSFPSRVRNLPAHPSYRSIIIKQKEYVLYQIQRFQQHWRHIVPRKALYYTWTLSFNRVDCNLEMKKTNVAFLSCEANWSNYVTRFSVI